jgi:hypothetical protein
MGVVLLSLELVLDLLALGTKMVELMIEGITLGEKGFNLDYLVIHGVEGLLEVEDDCLNVV